jgi:hypothetical protein
VRFSLRRFTRLESHKWHRSYRSYPVFITALALGLFVYLGNNGDEQNNRLPRRKHKVADV